MHTLFRWASLAGAVLLAFCLMMPAATEAARHMRSHELNYFQTSEITIDGQDALRIEIGMDKDEAEYTVSAKPYLKKQLIIDLENTVPGNLRHEIPLRSSLANYVHIDELQRGHTQIRIDCSGPVLEGTYKVYTLERDRKNRKPYRLVIDIMAQAAGGTEKISGLAGHTIVLDAGHGGSDSGAVGPSGVQEKTVTLSVTKKVQDILRKSGARAIMTRTTDVDVYGPNATAAQELQARCNVANFSPSAELFVSIHCNSFTSPTANGMETYYYEADIGGRRLATILNEEMDKAEGLFNRGVKTANFYVMKHTNVPASLIELAFVSNPEEEKLLSSDNYQQKIAEAVARGIARYFSR